MLPHLLGRNDVGGCLRRPPGLFTRRVGWVGALANGSPPGCGQVGGRVGGCVAEARLQVPEPKRKTEVKKVSVSIAASTETIRFSG